ncbi:baseplate J/gp47 family protein, partial [Escherichia coli]|uniref:baseplate J/gp47 family protein n=1 Tax=Escherichia coli TaxID=562 RepID=UPI001484ED97
ELVGVYRLAAQPATTTLQFPVDDALTIDVLIPAGTRVLPADRFIFSTYTAVVLPPRLLPRLPHCLFLTLHSTTVTYSCSVSVSSHSNKFFIFLIFFFFFFFF